MDTEKILAEINKRVAQRRQEGRYPAGLEEQLSAEFDAIIAVVHRGDDTVDQIDGVLTSIEKILASHDDSHSDMSESSSKKRLRGLSKKTTGHISDEALLLVTQALRLIEKQLLQQKETDARVMKQLEHAVMDRILMVDVLAEAVLELERKVGPGA